MVNGVGVEPAVYDFSDIAQVLIVKAQHRPACFLVHVLNELRKRLDDVFHGAVMVHVVILHIGNYGDMGMQFQEGAVAFIRFRSQIFAFPQKGIRAQVRHFAAHNDGRRYPGFSQRHAQHGSGRGLAVGTGYGNALVFVDQRRIDIRAVQFADTEVTRCQHFGIVKGNRRRYHDGVCPLDIFALLAVQSDFRPELFEFLNHFRIGPVRARDFIAQLCHNLGQRAHAGAANAYKMNFFDIF